MADFPPTLGKIGQSAYLQNLQVYHWDRDETQGYDVTR